VIGGSLARGRLCDSLVVTDARDADRDASDEPSSPVQTRSITGEPGDAAQTFLLTVLAGPDAGRSLTSAAAVTTIGTHPGAALVVTDPTVSRFHAEIRLEAGRLRLRDLGSMNGTSIDGVAVTDAFAASGASILVGRTRIRVDIGAERVPIPVVPDMLGRSRAMRRVFALLGRAAQSDATVLLGGETGTGKEVAAESLHRQSARRDAPFMVVDCAALPHDLLESELFGHEKGSFTGATGAREGVFEAANGGTVFLDEIGELGLDLQPKLLRVLERREVRRVGSNKHASVDVRIVAATNRDLRTEVNARRFRSDLYYRLAVVEVSLPPLRERVEDLPMLVEHFLTSLGAQDAPGATVVRSAQFLAGLAEHAWPGNVRELRNYVERAITLHDLPTTDDVPDPSHDPLALDRPLKAAREAWNARFERSYLEALLARHEGNVSAAARTAGIDRVHLYRLLWRHKLR